MKKAVLTFNVIDKKGEKVLCNMIESLDVKLSRILDRFEDLQDKEVYLNGNITIQFVEEE